MNGLLVKSPWIDLLLTGKKRWEIRGVNTKKRGRVGLIKSGSGMVFGTIDIVDCKKLSLFDYQQSQKHHFAWNFLIRIRMRG
ncbi:ASCH domain-containing protein [Halobacillus sp. H74]|uniref:ASCH domain-containing protein n=1 Tax=Halobacillus sp. H74 TaxID=3457436 RepID=UPI003FCED8D4